MPHDLPIPSRLKALVDAGKWPRDRDDVIAQNLRPKFTPDQVRRIFPEETEIHLQCPPFATVAWWAAAGGSGDFWPTFGALDQIVPDKVLIIGDFGLGSDAPIALDYSHGVKPTVIRLHWNYPRTEWVKCAESFEEFADMLGLSGSVV
jgi:hypothetical protein